MRLRRPSFRRSALLLAALAALHGLVYVPLVDTNEKTDTWSYVASANALLDGSYSTPLQAGFYFVYPDGWFDITGARIAESAWDEPERQVFRPPGLPRVPRALRQGQGLRRRPHGGADRPGPALRDRRVPADADRAPLVGGERRAARRPALRGRPVVEALRRARPERDPRRNRRARTALRVHACVGATDLGALARRRRAGRQRSRSCARCSCSHRRSSCSRRSCVAGRRESG